MPLEYFQILHQFAVQLAFRASPLGILLINQSNWLAGFRLKVLMAVQDTYQQMLQQSVTMMDKQLIQKLGIDS